MRPGHPAGADLGAQRGIPLFWQLFDCAFGILGIIPLWLIHRDIRQLARIEADTLASQ